MRRFVAPLSLLVALTASCLEGDPNPYDRDENGTENGTGNTSASGGASNVPGAGRLSYSMGSQCSLPSTQMASVTFRNRSQRPLQVYWVNFGCQEQYFGPLPAAGSFNVSTFAAHAWRLRDSTTNGFFADYVASSTPNQDVDIPP